MKREIHLILFIICTLLILASGTISMTSQQTENLDTYNKPVLTNIQVCSYTTHDPILISSDSEFESQGWPGEGSIDNPFIIEDLSIYSNSTCVSISNTTMHFVVRNCELESYWHESIGIGYITITLQNVTNGLVQNCVIIGNAACIILIDCTNTNITSSSLQSTNSNGIIAVHISDCTLLDNELLNSGIELNDVRNSRIEDNQITNPNSNGLHINNASHSRIVTNSIQSSASMGMNLDDVSYTDILQNEIRNSGAYGITAYVLDCTFIGNSLRNNNGYGIDLSGSGNVLYGNFFLNNSVSNARDMGTNNTWDDSNHLGNYWDNYIGFGTYSIDGSAESLDRYPQIYPGTIPIVYLVTIASVVIVGITFVVLIKKRRK